MLPDAPKVVAYLPHTREDQLFLREKGVHVDRFFILLELEDFEKPPQFELFTRYGDTSFVVPANDMIPICLDACYDGLFLVNFFADDSIVITDAPTSAVDIRTEVQPLLHSGCRPILFTKMRDPYGAAMSQLAEKIVLERVIGFRKEEDAVLAQVIAEGRAKNAR